MCFFEPPALKINRRRNKERGGGTRSLQFVNEEFRRGPATQLQPTSHFQRRRFSEGEMGRETQNGQRPLSKCSEASQWMVPKASTRPRETAMANSMQQTAGSLWILRNHREFPSDRAVPRRGTKGVAEMVEPPLPKGLDVVGSDATVTEAIPASASAHPPFAAACSESMTRRAGCVNCARPDLWGTGEGDFPGLPDWRRRFSH